MKKEIQKAMVAIAFIVIMFAIMSLPLVSCKKCEGDECKRFSKKHHKSPQEKALAYYEPTYAFTMYNTRFYSVYNHGKYVLVGFQKKDIEGVPENFHVEEFNK